MAVRVGPGSHLQQASYRQVRDAWLRVEEMGNCRSPVENVYLCGSGSHPGPGVSMAPGRNAAETICSDLGLPAPK